MKKLLVIAVALVLPFVSALSQDWANFGKYEQQNKSVVNQPKAVFMGDSITAGWYRTDKDFFIDNNFICRGISGQTSSHMLVRFRRDVIDLHPEYVVILAGTNDIALNNGQISLENILGNIISMCELARANKIRPILCSVLPSSQFGWRKEVTDCAEQIEALNIMIKDYAKKKKIRYVDFHSAMKDEKGGLPKSYASDGVHPNLDAYRVMEKLLLKKIEN